MNRIVTACAPLYLLAASSGGGATVDLGQGFRDHGVATPVSNHRGITTAVDGQGRNVALVWLFDHTGGYALLEIDAKTGEATQHPVPFPPGGDCPYASILSSKGRFYTHFNSHFVEYDPLKRDFTFFAKTVPQMAMGMTEDDQGVIWSVTYPNSAVASYNPATGEFKDYGNVYDQNWRQYQRSVAADDTGWIYFAIGSTWSQIIAFDPKSAKGTPLVPDDQRTNGATASLYRDLDGKVYGQTGDGKTWLRLYEGRATPIEKPAEPHPKPIITGSQGLVYKTWPDGSSFTVLDTVERRMVVKDKAGETRELTFDYTSEGAHIMGVCAAPDGTLCGGTAFPMRYFSYNPRSDAWINRAAYGQWNTVTVQGDKFYAGGYGHGYLLEWDPAKDWVPTVKDQDGCNPQFLAEAFPDINRPHDLLAHPDGKTIILAGTPGYGLTGGGLLFWDRETKQATVVKHDQILPWHSTMSLCAVGDGRTLLGGTTTSAGTGGESKVTVAELYLMDLATKAVTWHAPVFDGVGSYLDLINGPRGLVYGFAGRDRFFVFDPATKQVVHDEVTQDAFGPTSSQQGCRIFIPAPDGTIYVLFVKGIAKIDPETFAITMVAESPVPCNYGGTWLDGRIYFASGSRMYSYQLP